jgi:hypothetical protein
MFRLMLVSHIDLHELVFVTQTDKESYNCFSIMHSENKQIIVANIANMCRCTFDWFYDFHSLNPNCNPHLAVHVQQSCSPRTTLAVHVQHSCSPRATLSQSTCYTLAVHVLQQLPSPQPVTNPHCTQTEIRYCCHNRPQCLSIHCHLYVQQAVQPCFFKICLTFKACR